MFVLIWKPKEIYEHCYRYLTSATFLGWFYTCGRSINIWIVWCSEGLEGLSRCLQKPLIHPLVSQIIRLHTRTICFFKNHFNVLFHLRKYFCTSFFSWIFPNKIVYAFLMSHLRTTYPVRTIQIYSLILSSKVRLIYQVLTSVSMKMTSF
jgi:hypothetical protein